MIVEFENALICDYLKYLVPDLRQIVFAPDEEAFIWSDQIKKYPCVLVYREDNNPDFVQHYQVTDENGMTVNAYPFEQIYKFRVFLEKESEMLNRRIDMHTRYCQEPYVKFKIEQGTKQEEEISIGLWPRGIRVESIKDNYHEKGAKRCVAMEVLAHLVMSWDEHIPVIKKVIVRMSPNGQKIKVVREITEADISLKS